MDDNISAPTSRQRRNALPRNGNCRLPELLRKIVRVNVATAAGRVVAHHPRECSRSRTARLREGRRQVPEVPSRRPS